MTLAQSMHSSAQTLLQVDLLPSEHAIETVEAAIHQHNSTVNILRTTRCTMDIAQILDQGAFVGSSQPPSLHAVGEVLSAEVADQSQQAPASRAEGSADVDKSDGLTASGGRSSSTEGFAGQHSHDSAAAQKQDSQHGHTHHSHHHDNSVRSVSITHPGQIDMPR